MEHQNAASKIQRMELVELCKRRAENEDVPLRQIFDDVCRTSSAAGQHLSFADLEAALYKRRRRARPALPTSSAEADSAVSSSVTHS